MSRNDPKIIIPQTSRASIARSLCGGRFLDFIKDSPLLAPEKQSVPVAVLPEIDAQVLRLGSGVRVILLSAETAAAKLAKHRNAATDWRELQGILDRPEHRFYRPRYEMIYYRQLLREGKLKYRAAVIKRTRDGRELFVKTMYWSSHKDIASAQKKWERVG